MRCETCQRDVAQLRQGRCGACYKAWRKENAPSNTRCEQCGRAYFNASPRKHALCSRECFRAWKVGRTSTNDLIPGRVRPHVGADGKVVLECEWCGGQFRVLPYEMERQPRFCSLQCNAARKAVPRTFLECDHCGNRYRYLPN